MVHRDTVGELLTALLTQPKGSAPGLAQMQSAAAWTNAGATGWGADRFYLLASGATREEAQQSLKDPKGVWVTAWDTPADRDEFAAALEKGAAPPGYALAPAGDRGAVVFIGFDPAEREALTGRLGNFQQFVAPRR